MQTRTQYKPKSLFGCDYCGWLGNYHACYQVRGVGYATIDPLGNYLTRELDSENL